MVEKKPTNKKSTLKKVFKKPVKKTVVEKPIVYEEPKKKTAPKVEPPKKVEPKEPRKIKAKLGQQVLFCKNPDRPYQLAIVTGFNHGKDSPNLHVYTPHGIDFRKEIPYSKDPKQRTWKVLI